MLLYPRYVNDDFGCINMKTSSSTTGTDTGTDTSDALQFLFSTKIELGRDTASCSLQLDSAKSVSLAAVHVSPCSEDESSAHVST